MEVFIGTIQPFAFNFAPRDWALCGGQLLPIAQYSALFSLLGTTYGGNGTQTFALPNLQGRVPMSQGSGAGLSSRLIGEMSGTENVTLLSTNLPPVPISTAGLSVTTTIKLANTASNPATTPTPTNAYLGASGTGPASAAIYSDNQGSAPVNLLGTSNAVSGNLFTTGGSQPTPIMNPFLVVNFSIALQGIFPSRN